jgi:hypothetical protein
MKLTLTVSAENGQGLIASSSLLWLSARRARPQLPRPKP